MIKPFRNRRGAIALTATIILTAVIAVIGLGITFTGISSMLSTFNLIQSEQVFIKTDGCIEEVLIQLNRNSGIKNRSIQVDGVNCLVNVTGAADNRTLSVRGQDGNYLHDLTIDVQLSPDFGILNWEE